jgi:hypothetical protein
MKPMLDVAMHSAWAPLDAVARRAVGGAVHAAAARCRAHPQRRARELLAVGERHRPHRRRSDRRRAVAAVCRVSDRRSTNNIRMDSLQAIAKHKAVAWLVPLLLGDSHHGFPVLATTPEYFTRSCTAIGRVWCWRRAANSMVASMGSTTASSAPTWRTRWAIASISTSRSAMAAA